MFGFRIRHTHTCRGERKNSRKEVCQIGNCRQRTRRRRSSYQIWHIFKKSHLVSRIAHHITRRISHSIESVPGFSCGATHASHYFAVIIYFAFGSRIVAPNDDHLSVYVCVQDSSHFRLALHEQAVTAAAIHILYTKYDDCRSIEVVFIYCYHVGRSRGDLNSHALFVWFVRVCAMTRSRYGQWWAASSDLWRLWVCASCHRMIFVFFFSGYFFALLIILFLFTFPLAGRSLSFRVFFLSRIFFLSSVPISLTLFVQ